MKVVINTCYGGFGLSHKAQIKLREMERRKYENAWDIPRDDPDLIRVVEELGAEASGAYAKLKVVEIPDDVEWEIKEYDGMEWVAEKHRTWS